MRKAIFLLLFFWITWAGAKSYLPIALYDWNGASFKIRTAAQYGDSLYLFTDRRMVAIFDTRTYEMHFYNFQLPDFDWDKVYHMEVFHPDELLLCSDKGLFKLSIPQQQVDLLQPGFSREKPVMTRKFGEYIFVLYSDGLVVGDGKSWKKITIQRPGVIKKYRQLVLSASGDIWLLGDEGVLQISRERQILYSRNNLFREKLLMLQKSVLGELVLLTQKNIWSWSGEKWKHLARYKEGNRLFIDMMGIPWVYGDGSFYMFDKGTMVPIRMPGVVKDARVQEVFVNSRNDMFFLAPEQIFAFHNFVYQPEKISSLLMVKGKQLLKWGTWQFFPRVFRQMEAGYESFSLSEKKDFWDSKLNYFFTGGMNYSPEDVIRHTMELEKNTPEKRSPEFVRTLLFQKDPDLAIYYQKKLSQTVTRPTQIVEETYQLGHLYQLNEQPGLAFAVFQTLLNTYSISSRSTDWMLLYLAQHSQKEEDTRRYWEVLRKNGKNPVVISYARFADYASFARRYVLQRADTIMDVQQFPWALNYQSLCASNEGLWVVSSTGELKQYDPASGESRRIPRGRGMKKVISTRLGVLALTRSGQVKRVTPEGVQALEPPPGNRQQILDIWVDETIPFLRTRKTVFYFDMTNGQWKQMQLPVMIQGFDIIKILPGLEGVWYVVTANAVYAFYPGTSRMESLSLPGEVIRIFDAISQEAEGVYFVTNAGLYQFVDGKWRSISPRQGYWGQKTRKLEASFSGDILLALADSTVHLRIKNIWLSSHVLPESEDPPVLDAALTPEGDVYLVSPDTVRLWRRGKSDMYNVALNAIRTAHYLWENNLLEELSVFLERFTNHPLLEQWSHEFRARTLLHLKKYDDAYEEYRLGLKLNKKNPWISDTTCLALMYSFIQEGSWKNVLKTAGLILKNFPHTSYRRFLNELLLQAALEGEWENDLPRRLKLVQWLVEHDTDAAKNLRLLRWYHILLLRHYFTGKSDALQFLEAATQLLPESEYTPMWQYLIYRQKQKTMPGNTFYSQVRELMNETGEKFLKSLYGELVMESWLKTIFKQP